ncbi:zinc finger and BTB domain-containing protein 14-like isoform X1 [Athalia rosae]|uniref:zinc finger and BTB domain-containing protein 14-like isoform X1 n=1 Tax=Athalia rosae TaxID=37344 RepID=UPI002033E735|nr:zinc finger and BTB domain-containing protein 14-like isoform X1 [Athalia rosae]XP_048515647.1 zinc finger and BTB domain-containing protein 14-like isoform X1 [Athalia rosae]XP_048515648.1 zinc finger and BTB domain-containing protein 14-like isoform X1 [Athalia rosae]XP_048515649.1 zinc finger and BTB domain-containing protein 14-like isoform X1 [Athalia rosae]
MNSATKDIDNSDYSLKWNNFSDNLTCGFLSHLTDKELVDVTIAVEGKLLQAHKLVLSVCSPYFKEIFKVNPCTHPVVVLKDIGYAEVEALLRFMYKGEANVNHSDLASFLRVAEVLKIKGLAEDESKSVDRVAEGKDTNLSDDVEEVELDLYDCPVTSAVQVQPKPSDKCTVSVKRPNESGTRSSLTTPKKSRISPPPLRELDAFGESPRCLKAKSEPPEDYNLPETLPYFADEPLGEYLNSSRSTCKDIRKEDPNSDLACREQASSNSLISEPCSQGEEVTQGLLSFLRSSRGNLQLAHGGHIFTVHCKAGVKTYWKCIHRSLLVVEPVTYRLSARGRPQLVHEGYVYNLTSRSEVLNRSHYRCAEQHRGCRGKCAVIAERFMPTGVHEHNHPPGYQSEYEYRKKKGLDTEIV